MTIEQLIELANAAKTWNPRHLCAMYDAESNCGISSDPVDPCTHDCNYCVGARNAAEDVAEFLDDAVRDARNFDIHPDWNWRRGATSAAARADRTASYFGGSGAVTAFANAVREFCA